MRVPRTATDAALAAALTLMCAAVAARWVFPALPTLPPSNAVALTAGVPSGSYPPSEPAPDPTAGTAAKLGEEFERDAAMPGSSSRVADYKLVARLDTERHVVDASGTITWTNRSRTPVRTIYLHAYLNAFKNERSTFLSRRVAGGRGTGALRTPGRLEVRLLSVREMGGEDLWPRATSADATNEHDETDMAIELPRPISPQETVHIDVAFEAHLPEVVERTGYYGSFHMVGQWFPKIARLEPDGTFAHFPYEHLAEYYADFGEYDVTIDVPVGYEVGATGPRVSDETNGSRRVMRFVQGDIHDFAFAAYDGFQTIERTSDGVLVRCLVPHGYGSVGEQQVDAAVFGLRAMGRAYGAYPYRTLTIVHPPSGAEEAGGMEYPTLITTGGPWYAYSQAGYVRSLTLHELGHQYFYGLVATHEARWPFLDEGLTTYAEVEALDEGWGSAALWSAGWVTGGTDSLLRQLGLSAGHDEVTAQPAAAFVSGRTYGLLAYARTALILRTIDRAFEPGAAKRGLGRWARRYRFDHPGPSELIGAVRDAAGEDAARALKVALFERGWVDFAVADAGCDASEPRACSVVVTRRGTLVFPVDIDVRSADGSVRRIRWNGEGQQVALRVDVADIAFVEIDPEHRVLLDEDLANNAMTLYQPKRAMRVWDRALYAIELATHWVTP